MISEAFGILQTAFVAVMNWFSVILEKDGFGSYLLGAIFIILGYRFLLSPLFDKGSDMVRKNAYSEKHEDF